MMKAIVHVMLVPVRDPALSSPHCGTYGIAHSVALYYSSRLTCHVANGIRTVFPCFLRLSWRQFGTVR